MPPGQRGVGLFERLEQLRQLIRGDADAGVVHEEQELRLVLVFGKMEVAAVPDLQVDAPARRREFDGVAHQVGQDLLQAPRIAASGVEGSMSIRHSSSRAMLPRMVISQTRRITSSSMNGAVSVSISPASILEKSSVSLTMSSRA